MINTSRAYRRMISGDEGAREFGIFDRITFPDGTFVDLSMDDVFSYSINDATTESGKFQVGAAIIKEYSITLNNFDGKFDGYRFEGANVISDVGLKLADGSWEIIRKGIFRIVQAVGVEVIDVKAYDSMLFFDRPYEESDLQYPATLTEIIRDACVCCQMSFDASTIQNGRYVVSARPANGAITFRDIISYAAQIMGCYARIDRLDKLQFGWYSFDNDANIWGGIFDKDTPYSTGDNARGGTFQPWNTGDVYRSEFATMSEYHHLHDLKSKDINTDDIVITGVKVYGQKKESEKAPEAVVGNEGYMIVLENNPLIVTDADAKAVAQHLGGKLVFNAFRPMKIAAQSDPAIEAGDCALVSYSDRVSTLYTVITNTTFAIGGAQRISCSAEAPVEKNYTKYSAGTRILEKSKQEAKYQVNAYDIAVQQMNQLAANTMGFYPTIVEQDDGSILAYRHDKPKLSDSKVVYKSGIDGFWVTENYRGTDTATTWKAGFDSNGNAVLNILSVIGINFDWAHGGTLTLGGNGNGNGRLTILDYTGKQIGYIDNTGAHFIKGTFSGSLEAAQGTFSGKVKAGTVEGSRIEGTLFKTYDRDNLNGIEIEFGEQRFYYNGDFFGSMQPASDVIIDETTGSSTEVPYLHFSCPILAKELGNTSDERKKSIHGWDDAYDELLMDLKPIRFKWNDRSDDRIHTGFGAQTLEKTLEAHGIKNSALVFGHKQTEYSVFYTELHAIEVASIQRNRERIEALEEKIRELEMNQKNGGKANGAPE